MIAVGLLVMGVAYLLALHMRPLFVPLLRFAEEPLDRAEKNGLAFVIF